MPSNSKIQVDYTTKTRNFQLVFPINFEINIPADDSVRLLSNVLEEIDYTELKGQRDGSTVSMKGQRDGSTVSMDLEFEKKVNLETYRRLIPSAKKYGVKVCLENMFLVNNGNPLEAACSSADETCWYIDTLNKEARENIFGYCLDVGYATLLHKNIKNFILTLDNRLTCLHIHDNNGTHDLHLMPYTQANTWEGMLVTDWNGMLEGLKEIGYKGNISFESYMSFNHFPAEVHP